MYRNLNKTWVTIHSSVTPPPPEGDMKIQHNGLKEVWHSSWLHHWLQDIWG